MQTIVALGQQQQKVTDVDKLKGRGVAEAKRRRDKPQWAVVVAAMAQLEKLAKEFRRSLYK